MFNYYQTAVIKYLLDHPVVSGETLDQAFGNEYSYIDARDELERLGVIEWFQNKYSEGYQVTLHWSNLLSKHYREQDALAKSTAEKEQAKQVKQAKDERFMLIYSLIVSIALVVVGCVIASLKNGHPAFSMQTLIASASVAAIALPVLLVFYLVAIGIPSLHGCDPDASPALILGSASLAFAIILLFFS